MLRITEITQAGVGGVTLKLEGKLLEPWREELRSACERAMEHSRDVRLDLHDVSFIDAAGAELVRSLLGLGITISRSSDFVAELLAEPERL